MAIIWSPRLLIVVIFVICMCSIARATVKAATGNGKGKKDSMPSSSPSKSKQRKPQVRPTVAPDYFPTIVRAAQSQLVPVNSRDYLPKETEKLTPFVNPKGRGLLRRGDDDDGWSVLSGQGNPVSPATAVELCPFHVDLDQTLAKNAKPYSYPTTHVPVGPLFNPFMPNDHPNIDRALQRGGTMDGGHPSINRYVVPLPPNVACQDYSNFVPATGCPVSVAVQHPDIDTILANGDQLPGGHPEVDPLLRPYMPDTHPILDELILSRTGIPLGHPSVNDWICYTSNISSYVSAPTNNQDKVHVSARHPSIDDSIATGEPLPAGHPAVHDYLTEWMPSTHPNLDALFAENTRAVFATAMAALPIWHPTVDPYIYFDKHWGVKDASYCSVVPNNHPSIDSALKKGEDLPYGHPKVQNPLKPLLPDGHGNCDKYLKDGTPLPFGHPSVDDYTCEESTLSAGLLLSLVMAAMLAGVIVYRVLNKLLGWFCGNNDDGSLANKRSAKSQNKKKSTSPYQPVPLMVLAEPAVSASAPPLKEQRPLVAIYPNADAESPSSNLQFASDASAGDVQLGGGDLGGSAVGGSSSSSSDCYEDSVGAPSDILRRLSFAQHRRDRSTGSGGGESSPNSSRPSSVRSAASSNEEGSVISIPASPLPRRNLTLKTMADLHAQHKDKEGDMYNYGEYKNMPLPFEQGRVTVPQDWQQQAYIKAQEEVERRQQPQAVVELGGGKAAAAAAAAVEKEHRIIKKHGAAYESINQGDELSNSFWQRCAIVISQTRIPYVEWSLGTVLLVGLYLLINVLCLLLAPTEGSSKSIYGRGWGSLAAANTMLLIVPATRNSILSVALRWPFDHIVVYHRFLGRFAILCGVVHGAYYIGDKTIDGFVFYTGVASICCGLLIGLTSIDYIRRTHFNVFYFSHYVFVAFLVLAYFHVSQTKPFILAGSAIYLADKLLRCVWMLWPATMTVFTTKSDVIAHVRFPKNPLTRLFSMHTVGQYYFVNFPALSLTEWHPFSVSSGPREDTIELHIRDLGDHTNQIVKLAKERGQQENAATWICIDGPYGIQTFNYRKYPMMLLAGGGIGITPIMGMLKDIYDVGLPQSMQNTEQHCVDTIYLMWVMPHVVDYDLFREELDECMRKAAEPGRPNLVMSIYVTRHKENKDGPLGDHRFTAGRPNIGKIFERMVSTHPDKAGLVFACGPGPLVSELWDNSIKSTLKGSRIDFHHEVFDF